MTMTRKQREVVSLALDEVASGRWVTVDGQTIRWDREEETPAWAREPGQKGRPLWPEASYRQSVFITLLFGSRRRAVLLRVCRAPWVKCTDRKISLDGAVNVLRNPELELELPPL